MTCKEVLMTQRWPDRLSCKIFKAADRDSPARSIGRNSLLSRFVCATKCMDQMPEQTFFGPEYESVAVKNCKGLMLCERPTARNGIKSAVSMQRKLCSTAARSSATCSRLSGDNIHLVQTNNRIALQPTIFTRKGARDATRPIGSKLLATWVNQCDASSESMSRVRSALILRVPCESCVGPRPINLCRMLRKPLVKRF